MCKIHQENVASVKTRKHIPEKSRYENHLFRKFSKNSNFVGSHVFETVFGLERVEIQ